MNMTDALIKKYRAQKALHSAVFFFAQKALHGAVCTFLRALNKSRSRYYSVQMLRFAYVLQTSSQLVCSSVLGKQLGSNELLPLEEAMRIYLLFHRQQSGVFISPHLCLPIL